MKYPNQSKVYSLGDGKLIGVDQSSCKQDRTCLCIAECKEGIMNIKAIRYIEKQEDMDKYINKNLAKICEAFGVNKLD